MKTCLGSIVPLCCLLSASFVFTVPAASAQDQSASNAPPKVLEVIVEDIKPGQGGSAHEKTESAFVQAMRNANWPTHYLGMNALTGPLHATFLVGYDSFAAYQKDADATMGNSTLAGALDSASVADGALLSSIHTSIYTWREDLSLLGNGPQIKDARFFDVTIFHLRAGHESDWETLAKLYISAAKSNPNTHWACFQEQYGTNSGDTFVIMSPLRSLAEVDQEIADGIKLDSSFTAEQKQKMKDLNAASVESVESHLLAINPKMSYVSDDWIKASPDFWGKK